MSTADQRVGTTVIDICSFHCIQALCHFLTGDLFREMGWAIQDRSVRVARRSVGPTHQGRRSPGPRRPWLGRAWGAGTGSLRGWESLDGTLRSVIR